MKHPILSTQQASFYTKNRYLELEGLLSPNECHALLPMMEKEPGRDLWRKNPPLKDLLLSRKMAKLAIHLTARPTLQLACDQWFTPDFFKAGKRIKFKELFSVQGIDCVFLIQLQPGTTPKPPKAPALGLFPFPQGHQDSTNCIGSALIVNADLLITWPDLSSSLGLYVVAYSIPPSIYVQNANDPALHYLKQLGYSYGDSLTNETHPLIVR